MHYVFQFCVYVLMMLAEWFGTTYERINVWVFCVIWPVFTLVLIGLVIRQRILIRRLRVTLLRAGNEARRYE